MYFAAPRRTRATPGEIIPSSESFHLGAFPFLSVYFFYFRESLQVIRAIIPADFSPGSLLGFTIPFPSDVSQGRNRPLSDPAIVRRATKSWMIYTLVISSVAPPTPRILRRGSFGALRRQMLARSGHIEFRRIVQSI